MGFHREGRLFYKLNLSYGQFMRPIINIAVNPGAIGGTETFSRILNKSFPNSKTYSFRKLESPVFQAEFTRIRQTWWSKLARVLGRRIAPRA